MEGSKLLRITTVPYSIRRLLKGQHKFITENGLEVVGVSSGGETLQEVSENEKIKIISLEMSRKITPIKDLKFV